MVTDTRLEGIVAEKVQDSALEGHYIVILSCEFCTEPVRFTTFVKAPNKGQAKRIAAEEHLALYHVEETK